MNLKAAIVFVKRALQGLNTDIETESSILVSYVCSIRKEDIFKNPEKELSSDEIELLEQLVLQRKGNTPLHYLIGNKDFYGRNYRLNESVLIPRPETEELCWHAIKYASILRKPFKVLDIGTGSGVIAITLAAELSQARIDAIDISSEAIIVAKENAKNLLNRDQDRINFYNIGIENYNPQNQYDIIISNPPYIPIGEGSELMPEVKKEPASALFAGEDGLDIYKKIYKQLPQLTTSQARVYLEMHSPNLGQNINLVRKMLPSWQIVTYKDLQGRDRILEIIRAQQ